MAEVLSSELSFHVLFFNFEVIFTILYVDVKERVRDSSQTNGSVPKVALVGSNSKTVDFACCFTNTKRVCFFPDVTGGPDWTRTSDPALIKRML